MVQQLLPQKENTNTVKKQHKIKDGFMAILAVSSRQFIYLYVKGWAIFTATQSYKSRCTKPKTYKHLYIKFQCNVSMENFLWNNGQTHHHNNRIIIQLFHIEFLTWMTRVIKVEFFSYDPRIN